ncbi:MAG: hypothetical protein AAB490_02790 [Patescibacteria group bacterium]
MSYHLESTSDIRVAKAYAELEHAYYGNRGRLIIASAFVIIAAALFMKLPLGPAHWITAAGGPLLFVRAFFAQKNINRLRDRYCSLRSDELPQDAPYA